MGNGTSHFIEEALSRRDTNSGERLEGFLQTREMERYGVTGGCDTLPD